MLKAIPGGLAATSPTPTSSLAAVKLDAANSVGIVLDAIGGLLSALARYPIDMPDKPAEETAAEMSAWQRHATLGIPFTSDGEQGAVGVADREWSGLVRSVSQLRQIEHRYVDAAITELKDALWACVETVHRAVQVENATDATTESQVERARNAVTRLQTGSIKQEVLGAVQAIESALETRREHHREQYKALASRLDGLGRQLEEARRESTTDPLTGVGNRKLFDITAPRALQLATLGGTPSTLLMIDCDKLKLVNDMYGHLAGDAFIAGVGKCLSKVFLRQNDIVCRYGGDEFAVILQNTDLKIAETLGLRLLEHVAEMPSPHPNMEFQVGVSVGIALAEAQQNVEAWVERADQALYKAKQNGKARVMVA